MSKHGQLFNEQKRNEESFRESVRKRVVVTGLNAETAKSLVNWFVLTHRQYLQKAREDFIRIEIEKFSALYAKWDGKAGNLLLEEIHGIITWYKEELLELENGK